jgi:hypothetical protein
MLVLRHQPGKRISSSLPAEQVIERETFKQLRESYKYRWLENGPPRLLLDAYGRDESAESKSAK